jgi:hypothetical protein
MEEIRTTLLQILKNAEEASYQKTVYLMVLNKLGPPGWPMFHRQLTMDAKIREMHRGIFAPLIDALQLETDPAKAVSEFLRIHSGSDKSN